ncbi:MAG: hypothetical protein FWE53_02260 [Firmicutes bacterium]|nr:hypothetical protein [Bacillota bacterium]
MKNIFFGLLGVVLACTLAFSGCGQTMLNYFENNLSEIRHNIFEGQTTDYLITFTSGQREANYVLDGISGKKTNFGIVSVFPKNLAFAGSLEYEVRVNAKAYNGRLEQSPFDTTQSADIGTTVSDADTIVVIVTLNGQSQQAELVCVSSGFVINSTKALQLAVAAVEPQLNTLLSGDKTTAECYVKIISDPEKAIGVHYWFVSFINTQGAELSVIIDPSSGNIAAKKL